MLFIISVFIEMIFYILIFVYFPKKSYYEYDYILEQFRKNSASVYCGWYCDYFEENLKTSKNVNQALLSFLIILLLLVILKNILYIVNKCQNDKEYSIVYTIRISASISFFLIVISWILSLAIVAKVNKLRKNDKDEYGVTNIIKKNIVKVILLLTFDMIIGLLGISFSFLDYEAETSDFSIPSIRCCNNCNNDNIYPTVSTTRTNVIMVRKEKQYIVSLKKVLPNEVYSNLKTYIEKGKLILVALIKFYEEMKFEGLTEEQSITDEIIRIILVLSSLLDKMGDEVTKICIKFAHDSDALALLIQYLFPLIVRVIKLNIEKGIYRRCQRTTSEQIVVLTQLERTIERDEDGREYERTVTIYHQEVNYSYIDEENNQTVYEKAYGYKTSSKADLYKEGTKAKLYTIREGNTIRLFDHQKVVVYYLFCLFNIAVGILFIILDVIKNKKGNTDEEPVRYRNPERREYNSADDLEAQVRAIQNNRNKI